MDLSREGDEVRPGRIIVRDPSSTGDGVLDAALEIVTTHQGQKPAAVIRPLSKNLRPTLYKRLVGSGAIREQEGRILGVLPTHRWLARDARHETETRQPISGALMRQTAGTVPPRSRRATGHPRPFEGRSTR